MTLALDPEGTPRVYAFIPIHSPLHAGDVYVILSIPETTVFAETNWILARNLAFLGLVMGLTLLTAWLGGDWFVRRPVNALLRAATRLGASASRARHSVLSS